MRQWLRQLTWKAGMVADTVMDHVAAAVVAVAEAMAVVEAVAAVTRAAAAAAEDTAEVERAEVAATAGGGRY